MSLRASLQNVIRPLVDYRFMLSLGLSSACGIVLNSMFPMNAANPLLRLIALERPPIFLALLSSYQLFLYSTPFLVFSMIFSLLYVHLYRTELELAASALPPYPDPHIHPFVPLDRVTLAVAPQFPLASLADDNIVRAFSYTSPALFSAQNTQKEAAMRTRINEVARQYSVNYSIALPDGSTEIDLLLADEASSTVVMAELKWIRKPNRTVERISRDKEVEKGISQLKLIRAYARGNPDFLKAKGKLARSLADYANVHYLLVVRDHWFWVDPEDGIAIVDFDAFLPALKSSTNLQDMIARLLTYGWLPVEGRDFNVEYATASVYGMMLQSPEFRTIG